jgi:hypothetical protein
MSTVEDIITHYPSVQAPDYWEKYFYMTDALLEFRKASKEQSKKGKEVVPSTDAESTVNILDIEQLDTMESQMADGASVFTSTRRTYEQWLALAPDGLSQTTADTVDKKSCLKPGCGVLLTTETAHWSIWDHQSAGKTVTQLAPDTKFCYAHYAQKVC